MQPPSVQVSALSLRPSNEISSSPGRILHPKSFAGTYSLQLQPSKATSTNNDNVTANRSTSHQLPSPHTRTRFTQRLSIQHNQPAILSVISLVDSPFSRIVAPTSYLCSMITTATLSSSDRYAIEVHTKSTESSLPSTPT